MLFLEIRSDDDDDDDEEKDKTAGEKSMLMRLEGHNAGTCREFLWQDRMEELGDGAGIPAVSF